MTINLPTITEVNDAVLIVLPDNGNTITNETAHEVRHALRNQVSCHTHDKILEALNEAEYGWKTPPRPSSAVQLNLSERQAFVLQRLLNNVGGSPSGPRGAVSIILDQLNQQYSKFKDYEEEFSLYNMGVGSLYMDIPEEARRMQAWKM